MPSLRSLDVWKAFNLRRRLLNQVTCQKGYANFNFNFKELDSSSPDPKKF